MMSLRQLSRNALNSLQERFRVFISTSGLVKAVEQAVGIVEVRTAQENVLKFESAFAIAQNGRRTKQEELTSLQMKLKSVQNQLGKLQRTDDRYLDLVTEEHGLLRQETNMRGELDYLEHTERTAFSGLSTALRYSHERERAYGERTKYFSIIGSIAGAVLGAIATGLSGYLRIRELHAAIDSSSNQCKELQEVVGKLEQEVVSSAEKNTKFLDEFRQLVGINSAAILLAGVGEENPGKHSGGQVKPSNVLHNTPPPEFMELMTLLHSKLNSMESTLNKLSPTEDSLVIQSSHLQDAATVDIFDRRLKESLRKYTMVVGTMAVVSGVALAFSLIFSLR